MSGARMRRVDEAIREVLADAIAKHVKDPRVGFVTVTDVDTSPDLRHAQVFVSALGSPEERQATLEGLGSAHGVLQRCIAQELRLKRTPALRFALDDTAARAARLDEIIERTAPQEPPA
jgi:ribosome-binding factor A